ncbi:peptide-N(4)-(N-acetyl-beta-glucosaminyl)asparagine amidase-like [Paramacrobiotus metropolitanus]|uniref:peptide-N(4)-(N-acetyl-beta- glucosaminyl)asparagine amidase-like n=1 Tax=Paramacrobiotus metropolitanus TaxID=2943436 RepID=UPI00244596C1|nr:peptide-N(4)-(N-acetyl-beta-glucosaminyl)asparagine amidase-like [Paramacrobiotus metropolitanus]
MSSLDSMHFPYGPPFPSRRGKNYPNLTGYVFQPSQTEYESRHMEILYSAAKDQYLRCDFYGEDKIVQGYDKLCYAEYNTQRYFVDDWNLAYIGKSQFSDNATARIDWRFDLTRVGLQVRSLQVRFPTQSFNDGYVNVSFYGQRGDGEVDHVDISEASDFLEIPEAVGWREFVLSAELLNETENGSHNASQMFRQILNSEYNDRDSLYPFRIVVDFDDYESIQLQL